MSCRVKPPTSCGGIALRKDCAQRLQENNAPRVPTYTSDMVAYSKGPGPGMLQWDLDAALGQLPDANLTP